MAKAKELGSVEVDSSWVRLCCRRDTALPPSGGVPKPSVSGAVSVGRRPGCRCTGGRELQRWQCLVIRPEAVLVEIC